jgi:lysozyme
MPDVPVPTAEPVALPDDAQAARDMGAALIRRFEGCTLVPQPDTPPHWSIGYGCNTLADGTPVTRNTKPLPDTAAAEALLQAKLAPLADAVDAFVRVFLPVYARAALYSFAWNEGAAALEFSTLLSRINAGDMQGAADEFPKWVYAAGRVLPGLVARRRMERMVFLGLADSSQPEVT